VSNKALTPVDEDIPSAPSDDRVMHKLDLEKEKAPDESGAFEAFKVR
jgi:hypothetical protein